MKVFISADIEGVNSICDWDETEAGHFRYNEFKRQMTEEVKMACIAAHDAGATEIFVKDAHDSALNLSIADLPEYVTLHRGWEGSICSMMAGLDETFDACMYVGYHSPSRSEGNPLSHTMNTKIQHVKINGVIASEFDINSLYATYLGVPSVFLSGDKALTESIKRTNPNIATVATKEGRFGATISRHPSITNKEIYDTVLKTLKSDINKMKVELPEKFEVEIQYRSPKVALNNSFYPGCTLVGSDKVHFTATNYYDVLRMFKFIL